MKITYLLMWGHAVGGTEHSVYTQASAMAAHHDVEILSVIRDRPEPFFPLDDHVRMTHLVGNDDPDSPRLLAGRTLPAAECVRLSGMSSRLTPRTWEGHFSQLTDIALAEALPKLHSDVVVTTTPALMATAVQLLPDRTAVVHQEHRTSELRGHSKEPLLLYGPRLDAMVLLTEATRQWFQEEFGDRAPLLESIPNALAPGFRPRSRLDRPYVVAAGRFRAEKQFDHLIRAFAPVAAAHGEWRLRLFGEGPTLPGLRRLVRHLQLEDHVEFPGYTPDMPTEWAKASICGLTSRNEGLPLVLQEAMGAGVPVVSYDCPNGPGELVVPGKTGHLVEVGDIDGVSLGLLELVNQVDTRREMGAAALATSREWGIDKVADRWEALFEEVVSGGRLGRAPRLVQQIKRARTPVPQRATPTAEEESWSPPQTQTLEHGQVDTGPDGPALRNDRLLPMDAARVNLETALAAAAGADHFILPPLNDKPAIVVVPHRFRRDFLDGLRKVTHPEATYVQAFDRNGQTAKSGSILDLGTRWSVLQPQALRLHVAWTDAGHRLNYGPEYACVVQFWREADGVLIAPGRNEYIDRVPYPELAHLATRRVWGVDVPVLEVTARPSIFEVNEPVDVVYTWVDGDDPEWSAARLERKQRSASDAIHAEADSDARFRSREELRYSMRSLEYFAPWVDHVYLVTAGQVPSWLDVSHPRLTVVDHRDILPTEALPTFNSHAIESSLHHIDGLHEHFIYFNDDTFLGRLLPPEHFFNAAGQSAAFLSPTKVGVREGGAVPHVAAALNNRHLIERDHGRSLLRGMLHTPHPLRRSVLFEMESRYPDEFRRTSLAPFRSDTDLSVTSSFYQHFAVATGAGYIGSTDAAFIGLGNRNLKDQFARALSTRRFDTIAIGDYHDYLLAPEEVDAAVREFLEAYFPLSSSFER